MNNDKTLFKVGIPWRCTVFVDVKAKNKEEAIDLALNQACPSVCCHCSRYIDIEEQDDSAEITVFRE